MFQLDPKLQQDTFIIGEFALSKVLLMNDKRYPWVILVPRITGLTEIFQLEQQQQYQLIKESNFVASKLIALVQANKMNIAALGNIVTQLHIHHIARFTNDPVWPAPVWGNGDPIPYSEGEQDIVLKQLTVAFSQLLQNGN